MKILVTDPLAQEGLDVLREAGFDVDLSPGIPPEEIQNRLQDADAWIVRSGTKATADLIQGAGELKVIGRAGVGVDNIDVEAATGRGIVVVNTPYGNTVSVAEHTMALILSLSRHVPRGDASLRRGEWIRSELKGTEVEGKTLGLVGFGRIGRAVADRARGLGMKIVAYDPFINPDLADELDVDLVPLDKLWPRADYISVHVPFTAKTKNIIDADALRKMRPGVRIINASRGGVIHEKALLAAIEDGTVAGAALDVFETEPPKDNPLLERPEVVATPHLGASTHEASKRVAVQVAEAVTAYLTKGEAINAVNLAATPDPATAPFLPLAEALGSWALQLCPGSPREVTVAARGTAAKAQVRLIADAALKGLMEVAHGGRVNLVNARMLAQDAGISVHEESTEQSPDFPNQLIVKVTAEHGEARVTGTNLGTLGPRIILVDDYEVEVKPHGRFLVLHHQDEPGTISRVSGTLGEHDINIAQMVVGRIKPRGDAISILRVDDPITDEVKTELETSHRFQRVSRVEI
jgi:D-3-phosphoglycerate dehydrogenase / 2-oxoglutarate reductase